MVSDIVRTIALLAAAGSAGGPGAPKAEPLAFGELFVPSPRELRPSPRLQALDGRRVRLTGFMVRMEVPPRGAFYLASRPVDCDESGAGTGDLPPEAVRVVVRSSPGEVVPWVPSPLEVTGVLELGPEADEAGRVSAIRIVLDRAAAKPAHGSQPGAGRSRAPAQ
jgi:hypothetical protein